MSALAYRRKLPHWTQGKSRGGSLADSRNLSQANQDKYFGRIVRNDKEFIQKLERIIGNPWKRWPSVDQYPWQWPMQR